MSASAAESSPTWSNPSVLAFAGDRDPIDAVVERAREVVLSAVQDGWSGPPFDPIELASILDLRTIARDDLPDARVVPGQNGLEIQYNPSRPRGRLRYSIAHEISHTFFGDVGDRPRHRTAAGAVPADDDGWQLELLCNIAAGELLVPSVALPAEDLAAAAEDINQLMVLRAAFDVSTEAMLRRVISVTPARITMFAAAPLAEGSGEPRRFRIDYSHARSTPAVERGDIVESAVLAECTAVGFTAKGAEGWGATQHSSVVQAVGIPPYPGSRLPRVVGTLSDGEPHRPDGSFTVVVGDAARPRGTGKRMIVHVVNNAARAFGGGGFANHLARTVPHSGETYRAWTIARDDNLSLGNVHVVDLADDVSVASVVAQEGFGASAAPRLRYVALAQGLATVRAAAEARRASVHMPAIGTGMGGGLWKLIAPVIEEELCRQGIDVTVYVRPGESEDVLTRPRVLDE